MEAAPVKGVDAMKTVTGPRAVVAYLAAVFLVVVFTGVGHAAGDAWLGVVLQSLNDDLREALDIDQSVKGALISEVVDDSPADKAGLEDGDIILSFDGKDFESVKELVAAIREHSPGDEVEIVAMRDGRRRSFDVELGKSERRYKVKDIGIPDMSHMKGIPDVGRWSQEWFGEQGYLGVSIRDIDDDLGEYFKVKEGEGVLILDVAAGSPADDAGLKSGDVVLEFDGKAVGSAEKLQEYVAESDPGENVAVVVKRKGRTKTFEVEIGENESPVKHFTRALRYPGRRGSGRIIVRDDDGEVEFYGMPPDEEGKYYLEKFDLDDLDNLDIRVRGLEGLKGAEDIEELQHAVQELREEVGELRKELEKLKR
jgi:membrane-associated protease RseP (regulator of RpoE activity)